MKKVSLMLALPFLIHCGPPNSLQAASSAATSASEKVNLDLQTLQNDNESFLKLNPQIQKNENKRDENSKSGFVGAFENIWLPQGARFVFVYKNQCQKKPVIDSFTVPKKELPNEIKNSLSVHAVALVLQKNTSYQALLNLAQMDPCLIEISNDVQISAQGTSIIPAMIPAMASTAAAATPGTQGLNDAYAAQQKFLKSVHAEEGWKVLFGARGIQKKVVVGVIDTGVEYTHEDLRDSMWKDGQGHFGYDFANQDWDPMDDNSHGTHVTGLIGAQVNNKVGVAGLSHNVAQIMAVRVIASDHTSTMSDVINGIRWAADQGAQVMNISLAGPGKSSALKSALQYAVKKGVTVVVAAGNNNSKLDSNYFISPSNYAKEIPGVICVGSIDSESKLRSTFSNFSTSLVDLGAPGADGMFSTYTNNSYYEEQGTSMAAPLVSAAAAMAIGFLQGRGYKTSPALIEKIITESAVSSADLKKDFVQGRRLDLLSLAQYLNEKYK